MASMCVEITTTRAISPQILRHRRLASRNFSQRYAIPTAMQLCCHSLRRQDTKNRQNSIDDVAEETLSTTKQRIDAHFREAVISMNHCCTLV